MDLEIALMLFVSWLNGAIFAVRARIQIVLHPEKEQGYVKLVLGWFFWGTLPLLILGLGSVLGDVSLRSVVETPRNPFVILFVVVMAIELHMGAWWAVCRGGAELIADHPGLLNGHPTSPMVVKVVWVLAAALNTIVYLSMVCRG